MTVVMLAMPLITLIDIGIVASGFVSNCGLGIQLGKREVIETGSIEKQK